MRERVQGCVTVGVAMVGAGALALAPMAPQPAQQMGADQIRTVDVSDMKLLAATATPTPTPASLLAALQILGTGVGGSGERLVESSLKGLLGPIALAGAFGDDAATKAIIADYIDGPLYVADPTIFAIDKVLPAPYGQDPAQNPQYGSTSDVLKFRVNVLYALREAIKDALGVQPAANSNVNLLAAGETLPTTLPAKLAELAKGLAGSGQNFVVDTALGALTPLAVIQALGSDNPEAALTAIAVNFIDAPLQIADPTIFALDNVLPAPFGGDTSVTPQFSQGSDILKFRVQVLYALREEIKQALGLPSALDTSLVGSTERLTTLAAPDPVGDPVLTATRLAQGLGESGQRFVTDTALGALGPIAAAQALVKGDNQGLYNVVESYVDAPLHIADPTIFAIDDVLPKPIGGDPETDPTKMNGSLVSQIRANVLIPARDAIKPGLKNVLGVPTPKPKAGVDKVEQSAALVSGSSTATKKPTSHRATVNNPVSSALKKLAKDVKKATTPPKHAKASAE
jgi:hypothetical protein